MMPEEKDDNPGQIDRVRGDRGLARPSGFTRKGMRQLAQRARDLKLEDDEETANERMGPGTSIG